MTGIARHRRTLAGPTRGHCKTWLPIFNSSRLHITVILTALCVYQLLGQIDMDFVHIIYFLGSNLKLNFIIIYILVMMVVGGRGSFHKVRNELFGTMLTMFPQLSRF